jgi:hypothetical protein
MKQSVVFWSNHAKELKGTQQDKIAKYLELDKIEYSKELKAFIVHPIPGTNTDHEVKNHKQFGFSCTCQGWNMKLKKHETNPTTEPSPSCSHVGAIYEYLKRSNIQRRQTQLTDAMGWMFE